jgi:hypothetical protein
MVQVSIDSLSRTEEHLRINTEANGKDVITETPEGICGICPVCHPLYCLFVVMLVNRPIS